MAELTDSLRNQLYETVHGVLATHAISGSGHGNVSIRIPGRDEMFFTNPPSLNGFDASGIARAAWTGSCLKERFHQSRQRWS